MDYKSLCMSVCDIAKEAGAYIKEQRECFSFDKVEFKGFNDLVSYVDKSAEQLIVGKLRELLPVCGFITEEGTASADDEEFKWIIDPLDGTTNFVHGLPPYCVSIGLLRGQELVVGVVYEITLDEMFYAWQGSDAFLNGKKIEVSKTPTLEQSLIAMGFSYAENIDTVLPQIAYYQKHTGGIRRLGSAAAYLAYLACGRFDAFSHLNLSPWDVAGGALIAERAGAIVSDYSGGKNYLFGQQMVAANPLVYAEFLKTVK